MIVSGSHVPCFLCVVLNEKHKKNQPGYIIVKKESVNQLIISKEEEK